MAAIIRRRGPLLALAAVLGTAPLIMLPVTTAAAAATGLVYLVQGVADTPMTISVDGTAVATAAAAKTIVGPLTLSAGSHTVAAKDANGGSEVTATVDVPAGASMDTVLHRQVDPSKPPVITTFPNDLSPVAAGSGRLVVAHTAAVGPADVRVDQKVLFANIANGEALTVVAPAGSHTVDIVPTATTGPVVFGPTTLPVAATALTRVFAIGVAATSSMDAVVQVLPLEVRGAGTMPSLVNAGDGGQAAALISDPTQPYAPWALAAFVALVLASVARWTLLRARPAGRTS